MKAKILLLAALPLALMAAGCGKKQSEDNNLPATNHPAAMQSAPSPSASKSVMPSPVVHMAETNLPAPTNWPSTNSPGTASP